MFTKLESASIFVYSTTMQRLIPQLNEINSEHVQNSLRKPARPIIHKDVVKTAILWPSSPQYCKILWRCKCSGLEIDKQGNQEYRTTIISAFYCFFCSVSPTELAFTYRWLVLRQEHALYIYIYGAPVWERVYGVRQQAAHCAAKWTLAHAHHAVSHQRAMQREGTVRAHMEKTTLACFCTNESGLLSSAHPRPVANDPAVSDAWAYLPHRQYTLTKIEILCKYCR